MADKNDFTPEEWTKVLESIIAAGIAVRQSTQAAGGVLLKKPLQAPRRSLQLSAIPILTNSSRQQLLALKDPPMEAFLQCANALPRRSPRHVYSVH